MGPVVIPLDMLLFPLVAMVIKALGDEGTRQLLHHGSQADAKGRTKTATPLQSCPLKPDDDDPCKHLRNGDPNGPGKYRGGAHGQMKGPKGDELDSHHTPARQANELGGGPSENDAPAIQMERRDHKKTASYGNSAEADVYRSNQAKLIKEGKLLEAAENDLEDIKKVAAASGDPQKYDQALKEMKDYAECLQNQIDNNNV